MNTENENVVKLFFQKKKRFDFLIWWNHHRRSCLRIATFVYFTFDYSKHFNFDSWWRSRRICQMLRIDFRFLLHSKFFTIFSWLFETLFKMSNFSNSTTRFIRFVSTHSYIVNIFSHHNHKFYFKIVNVRRRLRRRYVNNLQIHQTFDFDNQQNDLNHLRMKRNVFELIEYCQLKFFKNNYIWSR